MHLTTALNFGDTFPARAKSCAGVGLPFVQGVEDAPLFARIKWAFFYVITSMVGGAGELYARRFLEHGKSNPATACHLIQLDLNRGSSSKMFKETVMSDLSVFDFKNHSVRVISADPINPLFVAKDVAIALGYKNTNDAIKKRCKNGVANCYPVKDGMGRPQKVSVIDEPDLYRLIFGSKLKTAVAFQDWVFEKVLPQIRQTGEFKLEVPSESEQRLLTDGRKSLSKAVKQIVAVKKRNGSTTTYQDIWSLIHLKTGMSDIEHATPDQIQAGIVSATEILEGELLPKVSTAPQPPAEKEMPTEQAKLIMQNLGKVQRIFHPFTDQFSALSNVHALLIGRNAGTKDLNPNYTAPLKPYDDAYQERLRAN